ncbi:MAG TPA: sugar-transfer associated ATP-grasp domain-containing protein [Alphaproteobacteria bacterium]|nr:sugar-transfer associated ATP-grasp domain-containing protein [Alphaproteobacteria bacterium]
MQTSQVRRVCSKLLWRHQSAPQCAATIALVALWPLAMLAVLPGYLYRYGREVARESGRGLCEQAIDQIALILRLRLAPKHYYRLRLYSPAMRPKAGEFLLRNQIEGIAYQLLQAGRPDRRQPLTNKVRFAGHCAANNLPHVPNLMAFKAGRPLLRGRTAQNGFNDVDIFVKPVRGSRGGSAERWSNLGPRRYRSTGGRELDTAALLGHIAELSRQKPVLVQPALRNHPAYRGFTAGALSTMRVISWRSETGGFEVTDAILRMPVARTAPVDNFHAGGIAAPIDIATGLLGQATTLDGGPEDSLLDRHPYTGAQIAGAAVPMWDEIMQLALRAHRVFDAHVVIGWDIAVIEDGPCLIEGNISPGVGTLQRAANRPLGDRRFGQLLAHHLSPYLAS